MHMVHVCVSGVLRGTASYLAREAVRGAQFAHHSLPSWRLGESVIQIFIQSFQDFHVNNKKNKNSNFHKKIFS